MSTFPVYNLKGEEVGTVEQPVLFQTPVDIPLIHRYATWVRSMLRHTVAHTKTRGEVSGGGRKPWRQKGTGRARVGSSRTPLWRSGGTVFGPRKEQTWATRMPRGERRKAFFAALAAKAEAGKILILDQWAMESPKAKTAALLLGTLPIQPVDKVLHIHPEYDQNLFLSTRNLSRFNSRTLQDLSILDVLGTDIILMTKDGLARLEQHFTPGT